MKTTIIKTAILSVANALYGFVSFYILPTLLVIAFNRTKGDVNNPDGKLFVPFGWICLILIPLLLVWGNYAAIKRYFASKKHFILAVAALALGAVFAVVLVNKNYSVNYTNILKELF